MRIYRIYIYGCMSQTPKIEIRPFLSVFTLLERSREVLLDGQPPDSGICKDQGRRM